MSDVRADLPLSYYLEVVWRKRLLVAAFMAGGLILAAVAYVLVTPTYEASTLILASQTDLERDASAEKPRVEAVNSLSKILESEEVLRAAIEQVGLYQILKAPAGTDPGIVARLRNLLAPDAREGGGQENDVAACRTSLGRSTSTGPGRPVVARWNASAMVRGIAAGSWTRKLCLVIGSVMPVMSASWNASVPMKLRPTCPVIATIGTESL